MTGETTQPQSYYEYHPLSPLSLGSTFDPDNLRQTFGTPFTFQINDAVDTGSPRTTFDYHLVSSSSELKQSMHFDASIDAHFLFASASFEIDSTSESMVSNTSITVVINASSELARREITQVQLTPEAAMLLKSGNSTEFTRRFGTRYVQKERRGALLSAVLQIQGVSAETRDKLHAAFKFDGFGVTVKAGVDREISSKTDAADIRVQAFAIGGAGFGKLGAKLIKIGDLKSLKSVTDALGDAMETFASDAGAPLGYFTGSMADFGVSLPGSGPDGARQTALAKIVARYRSVVRSQTVLDSVQDGTDPRAHLLSPAARLALIDAPTSLLNQLRGQAAALAALHEVIRLGGAIPNPLPLPPELPTIESPSARLVPSQRVGGLIWDPLAGSGRLRVLDPLSSGVVDSLGFVPGATNAQSNPSLLRQMARSQFPGDFTAPSSEVLAVHPTRVDGQWVRAVWMRTIEIRPGGFSFGSYRWRLYDLEGGPLNVMAVLVAGVTAATPPTDRRVVALRLLAAEPTNLVVVFGSLDGPPVLSSLKNLHFAPTATPPSSVVLWHLGIEGVTATEPTDLLDMPRLIFADPIN